MADDRARIIWHHVASLRSNDRNLYTYMEYKTFFKFDPGTAHLRRKRLIDHSFISSSPKKGSINTWFLHFPLDLFFEGIFTHTYRVFRKNCVFSQFTATYSPARKSTQPRKRYQCHSYWLDILFCTTDSWNGKGRNI